jgi:hypothetical protein
MSIFGRRRYDLCKWYVEEVSRRAEEYKRRFPKITYVECDLEQLNDYDFVVQMFEAFGLQPSLARIIHGGQVEGREPSRYS